MALCVFAPTAAAVAAAQDTGVNGLPAERPTIKAVRIDPSQAPKIDGDLSDPIWAKAAVIDDFHQTRPDAGAPATERTVVRILYDKNALFFSIYCYDKNPKQIIVRGMARDGQLFSGDNVRINLDPGATRRNGYTFQVGPSGGRQDGLLQNNNDNLQEWNTIWTERSHLVANGWVSEIEIPFRSISYDPNNPNWGLEIQRNIRHKNEVVRWSAYSPTIRFVDISESGTMTGITGISSGLGLDIQVYGLGRYEHDWRKTGSSGITGTGSINAYYKITPALTGTLTINPDFSDAPLDTRKVNTTRFSLFTAETRQFFLQDAATFEFGGRNFVDHNDAEPFFSRNIGLVKGVPVSIIGGGKLSGEYDGLTIGALSVRTARSGTASGQTLSVARITKPVLGESRIGVVFTNGDPTGTTDNSLAGADFQYRDSNFVEQGNVLQADVYYERSFSNLKGQDDSFGLGVNYPNDPWSGWADFKQVGPNFDPALGFANRTGIREYDTEIQHITRYHKSELRQFQVSAENHLYTGLNNEVQSRETTAQAELESGSIDKISATIDDHYEAVPAAFTLPGNVPVPAGTYGWTNLVGDFSTGPARPYGVSLEVECCRFYNGSYARVDAQINIRPNEYFQLSPRYQGTFIRLPTGSVDIHILTLDGVVNFTPDMQILLQAQYDNISQNFAFLGRYRWEYAPGDELFIAIGQSALIPGTQFVPQTTQFSIRLGHTFQF